MAVTGGLALVKLLQNYGVDTVFGIPGVHTMELYRGQPETDIRHILTRHEQGAWFMANGYVRVSGRPGVCFLITGPGLTNAATAIGQAYAESIPMLTITCVNETNFYVPSPPETYLEVRSHSCHDQSPMRVIPEARKRHKSLPHRSGS